MIVQSILGHKVAAAALALALGGTSAAAATGNLSISMDETVELTDESLAELDDEVAELDESESKTGDDEAEILPPVNDEGVPYGDVACDDAKNHGEYVSGVAKDDTIEGNRGSIVSQAAKTDCGKADKEEKDAAKAERKEAKDAEKAERKEAKDAEKAERKANSADDDSEQDETDDDGEKLPKSDKPGNRGGKNEGKKNK